MQRTKDERALVGESLAVFDRPEHERLRNFLPPDADVDALVRELFAGVERRAAT